MALRKDNGGGRSKRLMLVVYHREPGYIDGEVMIGLFEADNAEDARRQAREACKPMDAEDRELVVAEVGEMTTISTERTKCED